MQRRTFISSIITALTALFLPWRRRPRPPSQEELLAQYLRSREGRTGLATGLTHPLRARRDYATVGRKIFLVEQLPDGAIPVYDRET